MLCLLGAVLGCLGAAVQLSSASIQTGTMNAAHVYRNRVLVRLRPRSAAEGALLAIVMGLIGGFLPAIARCG